MQNYTFSPEEWATCLKVLTALKDEPFNNPDNQEFKTLITTIAKKAKKEIRKGNSEALQNEDTEKIKQTTIIANTFENKSLYTHIKTDSKNYQNLNTPQKCYVCNTGYTLLHFFYHRLCPTCAEKNYHFRTIEPNFGNFQVIITGGRVKIGFATALKFLRAGANVLISTRFPAVAFEQFSQEADFELWRNRLTVYGLDLRSLKDVYSFIAYCKTHLPHLDILINNAAQTIKYPLSYYQPLIETEKQNLILFKDQKLLENKTAIGIEPEHLLTETVLSDLKRNRFGQPIDTRDKNSWNMTLAEVGLEELLEVNLINHISPYIMISGLRDLLLQSPQNQRFIINVTSSEGQFSYANKTVFHPHTNMTKAALNMLTRTSAAEFVENQIFMNAVDVGWISTGAHEAKRVRLFEALKIPPLDSVDGAMRIIHPILDIQNGNTDLYGKLLKNYSVVAW